MASRRVSMKDFLAVSNYCGQKAHIAGGGLRGACLCGELPMYGLWHYRFPLDRVELTAIHRRCLDRFRKLQEGGDR